MQTWYYNLNCILPSWWFQSLWEKFPNFRNENEKNLWNHHLVYITVVLNKFPNSWLSFRAGMIFLAPCWEDLIHPCGSHAKRRREQLEHLHRGLATVKPCPKRWKVNSLKKTYIQYQKNYITWNVQDHLKSGYTYHISIYNKFVSNREKPAFGLPQTGWKKHDGVLTRTNSRLDQTSHNSPSDRRIMFF